MNALGDDGRSVLPACALLGRRFDWDLLPAVTGLTVGTVLACPRRAVDAQLLVTRDGFEFRHALTRDAVLQGLLPSDQGVLCRDALRAVEAAHPGLPGPWCDLAVDLACGAGDERRAAEILLEAGRRALALGRQRPVRVLQGAALERQDGGILDDPVTNLDGPTNGDVRVPDGGSAHDRAQEREYRLAVLPRR